MFVNEARGPGFTEGSDGNSAMIDTSTVWDQHADALRGFLASRVAQDDVEDLLQEAFVRIHAKLEGLRDEERLTAWVYQIARNLITDHYRKRGTLPAEADVAEVYAKVDEPVREYLIACVEPFISQLPETYRDAVRMRKLEGMTQVEVAERLGLSLSGAKSRVQRGRVIAKQMLEDCCLFHRDAAGRISDFERKDLTRPGLLVNGSTECEGGCSC
jgi:RNA polymerase sigma-70 factor (ECF subfamily)